MAEVREAISIAAPAERVWQVVHEDIRNFPRWTTNVERVQMVTKGAPGLGAIYRYRLDTPIGRQVVEIEHTEWLKPRRCSGEYVRGPISGSWTYSYSERAGRTRLTYDTAFHLSGVLRLMTGAFLPHYAAGVRENLQNLKAYIEGG